MKFYPQFISSSYPALTNTEHANTLKIKKKRVMVYDTDSNLSFLLLYQKKYTHDTNAYCLKLPPESIPRNECLGKSKDYPEGKIQSKLY